MINLNLSRSPNFDPNKHKNSPEEEKIFEHFIREFLPPVDNKRKKSGNELEYVLSKVNSIMKAKLNFRLGARAFQKVLDGNNYMIMSRDFEWDPDIKKLRSIKTGKPIADFYGSWDSSLYYTNVDPLIVRKLHLIISNPTNMGDKKRIEVEKLKTRIGSFAEKYSIEKN